MKGVAGCEKPREVASRLKSGDTRMGKPDMGNTISSLKEDNQEN